MPELTEPPALSLAGFEMTVAQLAEVWGAESDGDGVALLARITQLPEFEDESRTAVWLDCMYQTLLFAKQLPLSGTQTLSFFSTVNATLAAAVTSRANKHAAFKDWTERYLTATKAMHPAERFSLAETEQLTAYMRDSLLQHLKLITYVLTQPRKIRRSTAEYFVQRPAAPPPLSQGLTTEEMEAQQLAQVEAVAAAEAEAAEEAAEAEAAAAAEAAEAAAAVEAPAADSAAEATPAGGTDEALSGAIGEAMATYATELQSRMEKEFAARETAVIERITKLEAAAGKK